MKQTNYLKWDVHHHILPEFYVEEMNKLGVHPTGMPWPKWSPEQSLKMMKRFGIEKAFLSQSTPGVYFKDAAYSRKLARRCNIYIADLIKQYPGRFGGFASLPLPDVEGSLEEIRYALDELKLDGIAVLTNVNGHYLGDPAYRPVFEELNRRSATVFIHVNTRDNLQEHGLLNPFYWWFVDTTKTLMDMVKSGYHREFKNIRYIPAHGAGTLPVMYDLMVEALKADNPGLEDEIAEFKNRLYPDTAKTANQYALPALMNFADSDHILFGSDYMWAKTSNVAHWIKMVSAIQNETQVARVFSGNAKALLAGRPNTGGGLIQYTGVNYHRQNTGTQKFHYHCAFEDVVRKVCALTGGDAGRRSFHKKEALEYLRNNGYAKLTLTFDMPEIWDLGQQNVQDILRLHNTKAAQAAAQDARLAAYAAIDPGQPAFAAAEIDRCINHLHMDGLCLYLDISASGVEETLPKQLLHKLSLVNVPIMLHPKHADAVPVQDDAYLDTVYFMAKILYSNEIEDLEDKQLIFTHTGGVLKYLNENIGLMYYMQFQKWHLGKLVIDFMIKKKLKGTTLIENAIIDD